MNGFDVLQRGTNSINIYGIELGNVKVLKCFLYF